jgi:hypothetical protein
MFLQAARTFGIEAAQALRDLMGWKVNYIAGINDQGKDA